MYGHENKKYGIGCYMYIVTPDECSLSGFVDVGIGMGETPDLENFGKSRVPAKISGCYKVTWNGRGIRNAVFQWLCL